MFFFYTHRHWFNSIHPYGIYAIDTTHSPSTLTATISELISSITTQKNASHSLCECAGNVVTLYIFFYQWKTLLFFALHRRMNVRVILCNGNMVHGGTSMLNSLLNTKVHISWIWTNGQGILNACNECVCVCVWWGGYNEST